MRTTQPRSEFPEVDDPCELLRRWVGKSARQPALFFRVGWDWRWWSARRWLAELEQRGPRGDCSQAGEQTEEVRALNALLASPPRAGDWLRSGRQLDAALSPLRARRGLAVRLGSGGLEILVTSDAPQRAGVGAVLTWCLARRAVVVLAPARGVWLDTVLFARPTRVFGGVEELRALARRVSEMRPRRRSRAIDRLQSFVLDEPVDAAVATGESLAELGIELVTAVDRVTDR